MRSSERNRLSIIDPVLRLRSLVCTMPRQLPGVTWWKLTTWCSSPLCRITIPFLICVAGIIVMRPSYSIVVQPRRDLEEITTHALRLDSKVGAIRDLQGLPFPPLPWGGVGETSSCRRSRELQHSVSSR